MGWLNKKIVMFSRLQGHIFWKHRHHNLTTEVELRGIAHVFVSLCGFEFFSRELVKTEGSNATLFDNQAIWEIANSPVQHDCTKHIEVDKHLINEKLEIKHVDIPYVRSNEQLAVVLTHAGSAS